MTWVKDLIKDYRKSRSMMIESRDSLDPLADWDMIKEIDKIIADMNYSIEWMRTGRQPQTRRGVDIHDAYKRSMLMDMDLLPNIPVEQELRISEAQKQAVVKILMKLSKRELECYLLHMSNGLSLAEIATELSLKKRTVQDYVDRAKTKVGQAI